MAEMILDRESGQANRHASADHELFLEHLISLAEELSARPNLGLQTAPLRELQRLGEIGLLTAPLAMSEGGLGLGVEPGTHQTLLKALAIVGGADLALGRLYEGHVNGLLLVQRFGTAQQVERLAADVRVGKLSGVWNTGRPELLKLIPDSEGFVFDGAKTFATGAAFVTRPIVTAEIPGHGWQMTLPRMDTIGASIDRSFWHPLGMESSESFGIDFTGCHIHSEDLVGTAGNFYEDPIFRGGAVRFAAVHAGAVMRLHSLFAIWLDDTGRGQDPYQIARLGDISIAAQECALWVEKAAATAEACFYTTDKALTARMIECANMMRVAIERIATSVMQSVTMGVGAHGLLQPARFERILRDLTMYLRQPAPDQTRAAIGRESLQNAQQRIINNTNRFWSHGQAPESLSPRYFSRIYEHSQDPWNFETSDYERRKYDATLDALPLQRYESALEVGCSIGVLTQRLAGRCGHLLGLDVSEQALQRAQARCADLKHVSFEIRDVPHAMPDDSYDLIVVSEVAYYWSRADLRKAADKLAERHRSEGHLILVHLTEPVPDYPLLGDEVHDYWLTRPEWRHVSGDRFERFRIDVVERI